MSQKRGDVRGFDGGAETEEEEIVGEEQDRLRMEEGDKYLGRIHLYIYIYIYIGLVNSMETCTMRSIFALGEWLIPRKAY